MMYSSSLVAMLVRKIGLLLPAFDLVAFLQTERAYERGGGPVGSSVQGTESQEGAYESLKGP